MPYQVLARKYRPRNFAEMVGQEPIQRMLINALDQERLHHAYLFTGTRGVGKTSIARILAKCLNCETGITSKPCNTCQTCQAIDQGKFLDLIEVDAASKTKVEDTRELLDNTQYSPVQGRFKVYIIDEVHMLSSHSFNALLKTLEEPPAYVKFLLATTEPKKLPITILSRCLQFNLKRVPTDKIADQLAHICKLENIAFEPIALQQTAKAADGSLRDALSLLDQIMAFSSEKITARDIQHMLGTIEQDTLFSLLDALAEKNGQKLITEITHLADEAVDFYQALDELLSLLHQISLAQVIPDLPNTQEKISELAKIFSPEDIQLYYQIALIGHRDLPLAPNTHHGFEMIMLRMLAFRPADMKTTEPMTEKLSPPVTEKSPPPKEKETSVWSDILTKLNLSGMAQALAANCRLEKITDEKIELALTPSHAPMLNKKLIERIEQTLVTYFNKLVKLEIKIAETEIETPAKQQLQEQAVKQASATESIKNDSKVQQLMDVFNATLDEGSIKAI